jgi:hypothetical protein
LVDVLVVAVSAHVVACQRASNIDQRPASNIDQAVGPYYGV